MLDAAQTTPRANTGRFLTESEALDWLVRRLVEGFDPAEIWLFGSRARGDARPDSDFDLLVVAKHNGRFGSEDYELLYASTAGSGVACDIVPCSMHDFEEGLELKTSFVKAIVREGRRIYETSGVH
jgi:predicted nucleotidyltransferase